MIINFEKVEKMFGNSEDIVKSEMLQYVNFISPKYIEEVVLSHVNKNLTLTIGLIRQHLGSTK